jgi:radical SAM superfamily enzyme YgiQ (UPF0313 family)
MKVLFISVNIHQVNMITLPLGLACVATAAQRAGHEVHLIDLTSPDRWHEVLEQAIRDFRPDIMGISVRNIDDQARPATQFLLDEVKEVVKACRMLTKAPVVVGGAGYSIYPESVLAYLGADMGISGEGEIAFPALLDCMRQGRGVSEIPSLYLPGRGISVKHGIAEDLDDIPFPDERLWLAAERDKEDVWIPVQARRGCPMDCSYCSTAAIEGRSRRAHSPGSVIAMIERHAKAGFNKFYFTDNTFNIPSSYAQEICSRICDSGLKISWMCILYPWEMEEALVSDMAQAGCREVSLGFESGNQEMLNRMNKKFDLRTITRTACLLHKYGIRQTGFLLLGGPGETRSSVAESLAFADSLPLDAVKLSAGIRIYPHTPLARLALEEGVIAPDDDLLYPRFYLAEGLEGWLDETVAQWMSKRPHWIK